jgi:cAMP phosphodiesterase
MCYACVVWTINKQIQRQFEDEEGTVNIKRDHLMRANETRNLIIDIRKRQSYFFGHIRKEQIKHTVITGKISGKRQRKTILDGLAGGEVNHGSDK